MATKFYFHATTTGIPSGTLPSAEQSTKTVTSACNFEGSQTTNRLMNTTIGTSQATLSLATPANTNANTYYVSRWVSPVIYQTSVSANTWTYNFAARETSTLANFPCTSLNQVVWVNCYVWKPSNGTKYGTILDGNTAATVSEGSANTEKSQQADFTGSAVSSLTSGDACIVFEVWFAVTQSTSTSQTADFFYDGTTETAGGSTVSNHASWISTPETLVFTGGGTLFTRSLTAETVTVSESLAEIYNANRAQTAETVIISESQARAFTGIRALSTESSIVGESLARLYNANRAPTVETTTIGESLVRLFGANRALSDTTVISEAIAKVQVLVRSLSDTTAISESLVKILTLVRNLSTETIVISESIARVFVGIRAISETNTIGESLTRLKAATRALTTEITAISESLIRIFGVLRTLSDTVNTGESLSRVLSAIRVLSDTTAISESLAKVQILIRSLSDIAVISESLTKIQVLIRSLSDTIAITGTVATVYTSGAVGNFVRSLSDTTAISESLVRSISNVRSLIETTIIDESLSRIFGAIRNLSDTTIISESLTRIQGLIRTLTDTTIAITETVAQTYGIHGILKSLSDTISISDSITRSVILVRSVIESVIILESLARIIIGKITDYIPSLETDFTNYIDEMVISYVFAKWNATGQLLKGNDMIDINSPVEFKIGIHSSRPYQVLALEQQTEINKLSINKFGGGISQFFTMIQVTVMVQRLQRDIPIELSQMEKEIQRIVCHYRRNEIMGIDDLILVGMRREWTGTNTDWNKSIWSTKIYLKAEYQKVNTENY